MKRSPVIIYLVLLSQIMASGQETISESRTQKISTGALYYEHVEHIAKELPTVVFEAGALFGASYWHQASQEISEYANTIAYDRAGTGGSPPSTDTIRTAMQIAKELNELLDSLKIDQEVILVCHSAGGFYGRAFSHQFSARVKALVLIESPCTNWEDLLQSCLTKNQNEERRALLEQSRRVLPFYQRKEYQAADKNRYYMEQLPRTQIPTYIIFGNRHQWPLGYDGECLSYKWRECEKSLLKNSSNSSIIQVDGAGHHLLNDWSLPQFIKGLIHE